MQPKKVMMRVNVLVDLKLSELNKLVIDLEKEGVGNNFIDMKIKHKLDDIRALRKNEKRKQTR